MTIMTDTRKYRMYGLVPYNISPIQQAIQYGHAIVEYANDYFNDDDYTTWSTEDKTFIILNGGTTNLGTSVTYRFPATEDKMPYSQTIMEGQGTLNQHLNTLKENGIKVATFHEPDLGDQLTAVVFLVDDRVWDKETWPDYMGGWISIGGFPIDKLEPIPSEYEPWKARFGEDADRVVFLRDFLKQFRLA